MKKIIIMGAGGHASNVIDLLLHEQNEFEPVGILDLQSKGDILGVPILGNDDFLGKLKDVEYIFPAIGFGKGINNQLRREVYFKIKKFKYKVPNIISSRAFIRSEVKMGEGNLIQAGSVVDTQVEIGNNIALGFNVLLGHGTKVADHVTFSGGVIVNGGVSIGEGTFLGMGAILNRDVGQWCKISPGTACLEPVPDGQIAFGNPMRYFPNLQLKTAS